jgi:tRNA(Ile)-lysidine synthase
MLTEFEKNIAGFAKKNELFCSADKILLAVSGGADSIALLHTMQTLKAEGLSTGDFVCAHINHQLRGSEADADEEFVIAQAHSLSLPIATRRIETIGFARENKLSIETAARQLRLKSLLDIAKANNCNCIATGHQKNDNAETILQRLARGTGFRGLGGIWPKRLFADNIRFVRPLLCVSRDEILQYLNKRNLKWRTDKTNENCTYRRNFIRHQLLPALQQQCSNSIVEQLSELAQSTCKFYSLVCNRAEAIWPEMADCGGDRVVLDLKSFLTQPPAVKVELVRRSLAAVGSGERDLTHRHYERILQLAEQKTSGRKIELPDGFVVGYEYGNLIFGRAKERPKEKLSESVELEVPGQTRFGDCMIDATIFEADGHDIKKLKTEKNKSIERFDLDKLQSPLVIRSRQAGDRFIPLGLTEEKKVGKFLTGAKVPQQLRKKTLIIADNEKIIWVWPTRISEQVKINGQTKKILQLQITDATLAKQ